MANLIELKKDDSLTPEQKEALLKFEQNVNIPLLDDDNPECLQTQIKNLRKRVDDHIIEGKRDVIKQASTIEEKLSEVIGSNHQAILSVKDGGSKVQFKTLPMTSTGHITGVPMSTFGGFTATPGAAANARDFIPAIPSPTASWISYVEGATTGSVGKQTEGADKATLEFAYESKEVKAEYLAGYTRFSKQLAANLPFLQSVLIQQLTREFFKAENTSIATALTTAATGYTGTGINTPDAIIATIAGRRAAGYETNSILVNDLMYGRILAGMYTTGNYYGSGSVVGTAGGNISIWGTAITPVSWVADSKALFIDTAYVSRVVVEPLNIQFSETEGSNFVKNLITARVEELQALSILKTASISYVTLNTPTT